jgi:N6-L-threonylcarbamoyladenine synthase
MPTILAIESSCDDTGAAVCINGKIVANLTAGQKIHEKYGGVVPELASRAHEQHIIPLVDTAIKEAGISTKELDAIAVTKGPGLMGSLLVGVCFAKSLAQALDIPIMGIHHMQAHILAHFIDDPKPEFPFLCLTVSGGHTQLVKVHNTFSFEIIGETIDDAAGEAYDKIAKIIGLPYPGGPLVDKHAKEGNPHAFVFPFPLREGLNFSFSGLKTSVLYFLQKKIKENPNFIKENLNDLCASVQYRINSILMEKLENAAKSLNINQIGIAGGVSANSGLRAMLQEFGVKNNWQTYIPKFEYCTDNAAMIAISGHYNYLAGKFDDLSMTPTARIPL